jgi:hypothetical protein
MTEENKTVKVVFEPGCFDDFEGTQEELDELVADIQKMFENGEFEKKSEPVDIDDLIENDPAVAEKIFRALQDDKDTQRKLQ